MLLCYTDSMQEQDPNIMPRISITHVGEWIAKQLNFIPSLGLTHGDHLPRGGGPMLDQHLDDLEPAFNTSGR